MFHKKTDNWKRKIENQSEELQSCCQKTDLVLQKLDIKRFTEYIISTNEEIFSIIDHRGKPFIITISLEYSDGGNLSNINFYGYIIDRNSFYKSNELFAILIYNCHNTEINSVFLQDNRGRTRNQGYGSLIMESFLSYVKRLHVKKVYGKLSSFDTKDPFDPHHGKLLHHFYKKFGFKILPDNQIQLNIE